MNLTNTVSAFEKAKKMAIESQSHSDDEWNEGFWHGYEQAITYAINTLNEKIERKKQKSKNKHRKND
jgi:hypothetical protein